MIVLLCGLGVDVISISRIKRAIDRRGERFLKRVFTEKELEHCLSSGDVYARLAARFAAKEAVFKALGNVGRGRLKWRDVEIDGDGVVANDTLLKLLKEVGASDISLSLSHDRTSDVAVAVAILIK